MKKLLSLILAAATLLSVCTGIVSPRPLSSALPLPVEGASVAYDADSAVVRGLAVGATVAELDEQFAEEITVFSPSGEALSSDGAIATGDILGYEDARAAIAVYGDLTGDAKANARDVVALMLRVAEGRAIERDVPAELAADVVPDSALNARDVIAMMKYLVGYDVTLGERFFGVDSSARTAPSEDASLDLFFEDSLAKNGPTSTERTSDRAFVMKLARNEKESCQAILFSEVGHDGLKATLTPFANGRGETLETTLLFEDYITLTESKMVIPDRLPPIEAIGSFGVKTNERQGLYIEVAANEDTAAGLYRARLDITDESGAVIKTAYVYADVWDFAIPVESHVRTAVGLGLYDGWNRRTKYCEKDQTEIYIDYYEYFLNNRINPWSLPYDPSDERADEWMSDPRVNTFLVAGGYAGGVYDNGLASGSVKEDNVAAIYEKIKDNDVWMNKTLFYLTDEPGCYWPEPDGHFDDRIAQMMRIREQIDRCFPDATIIVPTHVNFWQDQGCAHYGHRDVLDLVAEYATAPCPKIDMFMPRSYFTQSSPPTYQPTYENGYWEIDNTTEIIDTYGTIFDRMADWRSRGHEVWWYNVTAEADSPFVNVSLGIPNMQNRMLWWLGEKYDIDGWLLWATAEWTSKKRSKLDDKNGCLVYPGDDFGIDGPIACQRTGVIRDGLEDTEYLLLAKELLGEDKANEYIDALVTNVYTFETDAKVFSALRERLGDELEDAVRHFKVETKAQKAKYEDSKLDLFFEDSLAKNSQTSTVRTDDRTFVMKLARNEKESCQAILLSESGHDGLNATLTPFTNCDGETLDGQLLFENYIKIVDDKRNEVADPVPDCLPPMQSDFKINAGERQGLYIEVSADENSAAGLYRARLDITNAEGKVIKTAYVYADVWDFAIPVESSLKTAVGMNRFGIITRHGVTDSENADKLYTEYYEYMLDNRVNPWCLPYDPSDERADSWMDDPRVNTFLVAGGYNGDVYNNMEAIDGENGNVIDETAVAAIYDKLKDDSTRMDKALFYCTDEPGILSIFPDRDKFAEAFSQKEQLDRAFPGARIIIPASLNEWQDQLGDKFGWGHVDAMELTARCSNVLCPKIDLYFPTLADGAVYGSENETVYGSFESRMEKWRDEGKELWWYTENAPWEPNVNISVRHTGMENRMTFWESYKYGIEGFLYWSTTDWGPKRRNMIDRYAGVLVYPGDEYGVAGPVACQRTAIMRDGIEDMEYLYLAEELLGKEEAEGYLARLVTDSVTFETDSAALYAVRSELGDAIEAAAKTH